MRRFGRRNHVVGKPMQQKDGRDRFLWRLDGRKRRIVAVEADVWDEACAQMRDVALVDVTEQRRRRLGQLLRELAQRSELGVGARLVLTIPGGCEQKAMNRVLER